MKKLLSSSRARWLTYSSALIVASGLIVLVMMVEISSQPQFCGSCHIMSPYFESWKTSSHHDVACVECHISPGVTHEIRKKWEAMSMVTSYITGTYGTNPWAEIDDAACLRCHQRRLLSGTEVFGDVLFDHAPHLTEMRNGKKLRCTSCHSQIVQGEHIAVTASTCILCHFKGDTPSSNTSRCTLCHNVPDSVIEKGMLRFDHSDVERFDMNCQWCHSHRLTAMEGRVPRERCFTCHNDVSRLNEFGRTDLMHRTHVTDHKVDCMHCHLEISHGESLHRDAQVDQTECSSCHRSKHSPHRSLYSGTGGKGVEPMPAPMFLAGVACEGCHFELPGHEEESALATEVSCMSCHGPRYRSTLHRWKKTVEDRTTALRRQVQSSSRLFSGEGPVEFENAVHNLDLVERGQGVHNVRFAFALLATAHRQLNEAREHVGRTALPQPWPELPFSSPCFDCHQGIETESGAAFGKPFSHQTHVSNGQVLCEKCHRTHDEKEVGEVLRFGSQGCVSCHHQNAAADCSQCHSQTMEAKIPSPLGDFEHAFHLEMVEGCADCHTGASPQFSVDLEVCSMCH